MSMEEFHQIFFEEADELIEAMEAELLEMVFEPDNPERINNVFRAAHSIKGGAATFAFAEITDTTHVMETLLNEIREGALIVDRALIDLLLSGADCVKALLGSARAGQAADTELAADTRRALEARMGAGGAPAERPQGSHRGTSGHDDHGDIAGVPLRRYRIGFRPSLGLFRTGNDPLYVFRALRELGELVVTVEAGSMPRFEDFQADQLYLAWALDLATEADPDAVLEAFEWVDDVCEISFEEIGATAGAAAAPAPASEPEARDQTPPPDGAERGVVAEPVDREAIGVGRERRAGAGEPATIRVGLDKIDTLINLVGELVITQSMLGEIGESLEHDRFERLQAGLQQLERHTRELQENVMKIRMVPISSVFNRMPRTVHDLTARLGKKIDLVVRGEHTELDKMLMERIGDPLIHLVRNAVDHGIEVPEVRRALDKPERGTLTLSAFHAGGDVVVQISDDGAGLDTGRILGKARDRGLVDADERLDQRQIHELVFHPGFSTADEVSDVSGRGVGMDVVRQNIRALGGSVEITSVAGKGSTFTIRLPLTLAIVDGQLLEVAGQIYVVPLLSIIESFQVDPARFGSIVDRGRLYRVRDDYVPVVELTTLFGIRRTDRTAGAPGLLVLVDSGQGRIGLLVDDLLAQQQVVIKSLEANFRPVPGISGATILGDGRVALIVDVSGIARLLQSRRGAAGSHGGLTGMRAA